MDASASKFLFLFLLSFLIVCSTGSSLFPVKKFLQKEVKRTDKQTTTHSSHGKLVKTTKHDFTNPPITTYPNTPVTNPVTTPSPTTFPPGTSTPGIVTVPSANPAPVTPTPVTFPPVTNPVTTPSTTIPGGQPMTNPVTTYPTPTGGYPAPTGGYPATNPVVAPPVITNAPAVPGQSWCVARSGMPETAIQAALDYACGIGGADCSAIQQGASCYNPDSLQNHASYAFNSYYQRNPVQTSCDFGGTAMITNVNPSSGSCIFPTWSPSSTSPTTTTPTPTPTTASSSGATPIPTSSGSPAVLNASNPALGGGVTGYGEVPPVGSTSSVSMSTTLRPFIRCVIVVTSIITGRIVLDIERY